MLTNFLSGSNDEPCRPACPGLMCCRSSRSYTPAKPTLMLNGNIARLTGVCMCCSSVQGRAWVCTCAGQAVLEGWVLPAGRGLSRMQCIRYLSDRRCMLLSQSTCVTVLAAYVVMALSGCSCHCGLCDNPTHWLACAANLYIAHRRGVQYD